MSALKMAGAPPTGAIVHADGSFTILTGPAFVPPMPPTSDNDDWLAGIGDGQKNKIRGARNA